MFTMVVPTGKVEPDGGEPVDLLIDEVVLFDVGESANQLN